jgi:hypothetical protein
MGILLVYRAAPEFKIQNTKFKTKDRARAAGRGPYCIFQSEF